MTVDQQIAEWKGRGLDFTTNGVRLPSDGDLLLPTNTTAKVPKGGIGICIDCNREYTKKAVVQKYCVQCSANRDDERKKRWAKKTGYKRKPGATAAHAKTARSKCIATGAARNQDIAQGVTWNAGLPIPYRWKTVFAIPYGRELSKNHLYRVGSGGHVYRRQESKRYREMVTLKTKEAVRGMPVVQAKVWIDVLVQKPNQKSDAINVIDLLFDGIKDGLGVDDRWFCIGRLDWQIVKVEPAIIISIGQTEKSHRIVCSYCGKILRLDRFGLRKRGKLGRSRECNKCRRGERGVA